MDDLISRNALLEFIHDGKGKDWFNSVANRLTAADCVNAQPAVDAADVVRCRECSLRETPDCGMADWRFEDGKWIKHDNWETDNGFCSEGKRKEAHDERG